MSNSNFPFKVGDLIEFKNSTDRASVDILDYYDVVDMWEGKTCIDNDAFWFYGGELVVVLDAGEPNQMGAHHNVIVSGDHALVKTYGTVAQWRKNWTLITSAGGQ